MKKDILYENHILRNTNYYLLCTIYNLEKQKVNHLSNIIKDIPEKREEIENNNEDIISIEIQNLLKEKDDEYSALKSELQNLKIEMEIQKEFSTNKIKNLENIKSTLELDKKDNQTTDIIVIPVVQELDIIKKDKEIEKLKRENSMLMINNQQLQFELIRTIKFM